jgi:hypothetical protein
VVGDGEEVGDDLCVGKSGVFDELIEEEFKVYFVFVDKSDVAL